MATAKKNTEIYEEVRSVCFAYRQSSVVVSSTLQQVCVKKMPENDSKLIIILFYFT